jgi:hypothetical protein
MSSSASEHRLSSFGEVAAATSPKDLHFAMFASINEFLKRNPKPLHRMLACTFP